MNPLRLEPFEAQGIARLFEWADSPALLFDWMGSRVTWPLTAEQIYILHAPARLDPPELFPFQVFEGADCVGHVELGVNRRNTTARIERLLIAPAARGRGLGAALINLVCDTAFGELPRLHPANPAVHRLELAVFPHNMPALRCYERAGFVREGVQRQARRRQDGQLLDLIQMAILREECDAIRTSTCRDAARCPARES